MTAPRLYASLLFHLNLSYSAIETEAQGEVVRRCYRPLLELCASQPDLRIGIEASLHTLQRARALDASWFERLRDLIERGRVEWVGSGDSQVVGPLVPASVNRWNQRLGVEGYRELLGRAPSVALVNEMAWSQGIVDAYRDAGYRTLVMEWNNPRRSHPEWEARLRYGTVRTASPSGQRIRVLWADAIAFQKLQRVAMGELDADAYVAWVLEHASNDEPRHLSLYANDAEIFDFRPGRYHAEPTLDPTISEWHRIADAIARLREQGVAFRTPGEIAADERFDSGEEVTLTHVSDPVPVKKQPKYNATRWGLTGRDDVGLNSACFARARALEESDAGPEEWRTLCRDWASDLRTHLTERRWRDSASLRDAATEEAVSTPVAAALERADVRRKSDRVLVQTDGVRLELCERRGLAIRSLAFPRVREAPLAGTLDHGHFDAIDWAADFYSGHTVLDLPASMRVTDLERVTGEVETFATHVEVRAEVPTRLGPLSKCVRVFADRVELAYGLAALGERPACSLRTGFVTLLPAGLGDDLEVECASGGSPERFPVASGVDHGAPVSPLVSARTVFGATDGRLALQDRDTTLELRWPNWRAAALPLLSAHEVDGKRFVRVGFSLAELDETQRPGAPLYDFCLSLTARRRAS